MKLRVFLRYRKGSGIALCVVCVIYALFMQSYRLFGENIINWVYPDRVENRLEDVSIIFKVGSCTEQKEDKKFINKIQNIHKSLLYKL